MVFIKRYFGGVVLIWYGRSRRKRLLKIAKEGWGCERKREKKIEKRERKRVAIYSNLTLDSVALNNRYCLRWDWSPFNNGFLSNEFVLSAPDGPGRAGILLPVSRCCDSKELEINLGYNNFFCGPRPTTRINQISSFHANAPVSRSRLSHSPLRLDALAFAPGHHPHPTCIRPRVLSFSLSDIFSPIASTNNYFQWEPETMHVISGKPIEN